MLEVLRWDVPGKIRLNEGRASSSVLPRYAWVKGAVIIVTDPYPGWGVLCDTIRLRMKHVEKRHQRLRWMHKGSLTVNSSPSYTACSQHWLVVQAAFLPIRVKPMLRIAWEVGCS